MDRPTRGVAPGGVTAGVGAACQAVADHLARDGRLQPSVWLERGGRLWCVAGAGAGDAGAPAAHPGPSAPILDSTFAGGVETVVPDLSRAAAPGLAANTHGGDVVFRARVCLPIRCDGRVVGVLDALLREPIQPADLESLREAAAEIAGRIAVRGDRRAEHPAQRVLRHVARLSALQEPDAIARTVLTAALDLMELDTAALLRRGVDGRLQTLASIGPLAATLRTAAADALEAIAGAADGTASVIVAGAADAGERADGALGQSHSTVAEDRLGAPHGWTPERRALEAAGAGALIAVGLAVDGETDGLLLLAGDALAPTACDDVELLEALTANAASCLRTAELLRSLRERAATDPLTGLGHHATFHETLASSHRRPSTAVVLCDIDGFKRLNDTYGHQHGDGVLRGVAAALGSALRRGDTLFRIGGDEFAALLAVSSPEEALEAGQRLRAAVERADLGVTVSIGVAVPQDDEPDAAVLSRTDRALYRVKASGRDGVALAADEPLPVVPPL